MEHPFPTIQRTRFRSQSFSGYFVRWLGPEGVKRTPSTSLLEERDAETDISPSPLCHELQLLTFVSSPF